MQCNWTMCQLSNVTIQFNPEVLGCENFIQRFRDFKIVVWPCLKHNLKTTAQNYPGAGLILTRAFVILNV